MKNDLLDILKEVELKNEAINNVFDSTSFLDDIISMLWNRIEEEFGIEIGDERTGEILILFCQNQLTKDEAIKKLKELA